MPPRTKQTMRMAHGRKAPRMMLATAAVKEERQRIHYGLAHRGSKEGKRGSSSPGPSSQRMAEPPERPSTICMLKLCS